MVHPRLLILLLPSHGMEDLPDSPEEAEAEELLAVFACLAHPAAVKVVTRPPIWERADLPPAVHDGDVILVPSGCESWMEPTWIAEAEANGAAVIQGHTSLVDWFDAISVAYGEPPCPDDVREAFASVGLMRLFVERLARRLHDFDGIDETRLFHALRSAAEACSDDEAVETPFDISQMASCFDPLLEYRERIHPLDPYLLDVMMLNETDADSLNAVLLSKALQVQHTTLETVCVEPTGNDDGAGEDSNSDDHDTEDHDTRENENAPLPSLRVPVNLMADKPAWETLLEARPELAESVRSLWPEKQVDLLIGEGEDSETRLEPIEVTAGRLQDVRKWTIDRFGRPPRVWARREYGLHPDMPAILKSVGYEGALHLTFDVGPYPEMEDAKLTWQSTDRTGIEAFSRLPVPAARASTCWQLIDRLGESIEFDAASAVMFVRWADGDPWWFRLIRQASSVAPVLGRFATVGEFLAEADGHSSVLSGKPREYGSAALAKRAALRSPDPLSEEVQRWQQYGNGVVKRVSHGLAELVAMKELSADSGSETSSESQDVRMLATAIAGPGEATGTMIVNPLPFARVAAVDVGDGPRRAEAPAYGYAWIADSVAASKGKPLVEELRLRNEFFELEISEKTGGLKRLMQHARRGNFLSQHTARRIDEDTYLVASAQKIQTVEESPVRAAIESTSVLTHPDGTEVGTVIQTISVVRGRPWFDIEVEFEGLPIDDGNPWIEYDAVRFAWASEYAAISQSCGFCPSPAGADRLESPLFVEIDDDPVVTIATHGRTFHRRSDRMLDSLVGVSGETQRTAKFSIGVGVKNPGALALSAMIPDDVLTIRTARPSVESAWLASVDRAGVVILGIRREVNDDGDVCFVLRVQETNDASGVATIRLCRPVAEAFARDLSGRLTDRMTIRDGAIEVRLRENQMRDLVVKLA